MRSDAYEVSLDEITEFQNGFAFKSSDYVEPSAGTEEVLRMGYIMRGGGYKEDETPVFIPEEYPKSLSRYRLKRGDIVMAMTDMKNNVAILGNTARIPESGRFVLNQRVGRIRVLDPEVVDPLFLYYYTNSPDFIEDIRSRANSGVQVNLSTAAIKASKVRLPPIGEQRSIGDTLNAMDEKIANNRALAADLEAMARAIFKSWFVDFDPVKAKMDGRAPAGMDSDTAALFPDELVESELGLIPEGWKVGCLTDLVELNPRCILKKDTPAPYLEMSKVPVSGHVPENIVLRDFSSGTKFQTGDTLLARITPCLENGKAAHVDFLADGQVGWGSTEFIVLRPKAPVPAYFAYLLCRHEPFREHAISSMTGTSGRQRVQADSLANWQMALPPEGVFNDFKNIIEPLRKLISSLGDESRELAQIRQTLLPRLISGKLRLPCASTETESIPSEEHTDV